MSDEAKFTRGPWLKDGLTVYALQDVPASERRRGWPEKENRVYFGIQAHRDVPAEEREATAFLMHAAEDLYEAVEGLMEIAKQAMPDSYFESDSRVNKARAALAKARGK